MKVISFVNNKGGVGKTTLCSNLARALQLRADNQIQLIDADRSLRVWHSLNGFGLNLDTATNRASLLDGNKMAKKSGMDFNLIDTGGKLNEVVGAAIGISDLVIIPLRASPLDVWATMDTVNIMTAAMAAHEAIKARFVITLATHSSVLLKDVITTLQQEVPHIPVCESIIYGRVAFANTVSNGNSVFETKDKSAKQEMDSLTDEIIRILNENTQEA
jgi:chromosome partitioning protein